MLQDDPPFVGERDGKVDIEIVIKDSDFVKIASGQLKPDQVLFWILFYTIISK